MQILLSIIWNFSHGTVQSISKTIPDIEEVEPEIAGIPQCAEAGSAGFMRISFRSGISVFITSMRDIDEVALAIGARILYATMQR